MSKKSIYVKHQDDIVRKIIDVMEKMPISEGGRPSNKELDIDEGYIKALKWVLGLNEKEDEDE